MKISVDGIRRIEGAGTDPIIKTLPANMPYDPYKMPVGPGRSNPYGTGESYEDLRWLIS